MPQLGKDLGHENLGSLPLLSTAAHLQPAVASGLVPSTSPTREPVPTPAATQAAVARCLWATSSMPAVHSMPLQAEAVLKMSLWAIPPGVPVLLRPMHLLLCADSSLCESSQKPCEACP